MADETMTCNEFKQAFEAIFGPCEWKATKDDQIFQSKGWKEQTYRVEVIPQLTMKAKK